MDKGINTVKTKYHIDLDKLNKIVFEDIDLLLNSLNLEYDAQDENIFMCCPIHAGSDNPKGLSISKSRKHWKCWTRSCESEYNSDIFGFVKGVLSRGRNDATFIDALNYIKSVYGIRSNKSLLKVQVNDPDELSNIVKIFKKKERIEPEHINVQTFKTIGSSPYFEQRGFLPETLKLFGVQDCEDGKSFMYHRSIIPVHSQSGVLRGIIGRSNKSFILPKYTYTKGFKKSYYLYNYHRAIECALDKHCLFVTEGQGDVWRLREAGVVNAVGLLGRDLSGSQKDILIKSGITTLVVVTDNDQSGRESKLKIFRDLNRMFRIIFPKMTKKDVGDMNVQEVTEKVLSQAKGLY